MKRKNVSPGIYPVYSITVLQFGLGWSIITFFSHLTSGVWESVTIPKTFTVIFFGNFLGSSSLPRDVIAEMGIMRVRPNIGKFHILLQWLNCFMQPHFSQVFQLEKSISEVVQTKESNHQQLQNISKSKYTKISKKEVHKQHNPETARI